MNNSSPSNGTITSRDDFETTPAGHQKYWDEELQAAIKEVGKWHKQGEKIINAYLDKRGEQELNDNKVNLFHANTNILVSALYSKVPHPEVNRRFPNYDDQVSRVAALILERALKYELSTDQHFDQVAKNVVFDRLVPGAGVAWNRYDAEINEIQVSNDDFDDPYATHTEEHIDDEQTPIDYVHWKDFLWSPARTWSEVRWVARRVFMTQDQLEARFGEGCSANLGNDSTIATQTLATAEPTNNVLKQFEIWEIWDKTSKQIIWIKQNATEALDVQDDFLTLPDFFPCPKPLLAATSTSNLVPTPDYALVQDQYQELNNVNARITKLTAALKVVGLYDAGSDGIKRMLSEGTDNEMIPVKNWAGFSEKGGVNGQVDWLPLDKVTTTLTQLQGVREKVKAQIYELTGISDIVRGTTDPLETATAQQLKSSYANIRLQTLQHEAADFFSGLIHRKASLMCKFYEPERLLERCGQLNNMDQPFIGPALQLLKSDFHSMFRINVTVDSLAMPNHAQDEKNAMQFLSAIGGFFEKAMQLSQAAPEATGLALQLLKHGVSQFRAGRDVEGMIDQYINKFEQDAALKKQQPPQPSKEQVEAQQTQAKMQHEMEIQQAKMQLEIQKLSAAQQQAQADNLIRVQELQHQLEKERANYSLQQQKFAVESQRTQSEMAMESQRNSLETHRIQHDIAVGTIKLAHEQAQHHHEMTTGE